MQIQVCLRHLNQNPLILWTQDTRKWSWIVPISFSVSWCLKTISTNPTEPTGSMRSIMLRKIHFQFSWNKFNTPDNTVPQIDISKKYEELQDKSVLYFQQESGPCPLDLRKPYTQMLLSFFFNNLDIYDCVQNCHISVYGCSPIWGTKFYSCWNLLEPGSQSKTCVLLG